jgi:mRNA interferase MazF
LETASKWNRGSVYWVNLDPTQGSEIKKIRPCVLIGATPVNQARRTVLVVPLSSSGAPRPPITVTIQCMGKDVVAVCDQIRAVDKGRLLQWVELIAPKSLQVIEQALQRILVLA